MPAILQYSTFLGGSASDYGEGIAVDASGAAYVTGYTNSADFPTTPGAFDPTYNNNDAFVTKLNAEGSGLVYSTFLGGNGWDIGSGITLDGAGAAYVTGYTSSADFPTTPGAFDPSYNGGSDDAFVTKLNAEGSGLVYSTFLGGSNGEEGHDIAVDGAGAAYVTGKTGSADFPTTPGAFDTTYNGGGQYPSDAFVTKLNADGSGLVYSTFLGGSSDECFFHECAIVVDGAGMAYVTGYTSSADFPTTPGAFDPSYNGGSDDAFVTKLNAEGSGLVYSTFLGGSSDECYDYLFTHNCDITVDSDGTAYVTGTTDSTNFPTTPGAFDPSYNGYYDAFVTKLNA